jgi:A/G-specific adenine glycosylase
MAIEDRHRPAAQGLTSPVAALLPDDRRDGIRDALIGWFATARRDLPWRGDYHPYAVWVSEMMLQQTQVATVIPFFQRWMTRFPTLEALASADEQDVLHAWQGLGYYSRARNLLRGARAVMEQHGGQVPSEVAQLLALPGVGPYTAGAIASIAHNVRAPIVDGNVIRVLARLFALRGDPTRAPLKGRLWDLAAELAPEQRAREFNSGLMELGAMVCTPVRPKCDVCPLADACAARRQGVQAELPETPARPEITAVRMAAALLRRGSGVLLVQRNTDEARWAGMWQFPSVEVQTGESPSDAARRAVAEAVGLKANPRGRVTEVRHSVTRYRITLEVFECLDSPGEPAALGCRDWRWVEWAGLDQYALPKAHRTIADRVLREGGGDVQLGLGIGA